MAVRLDLRPRPRDPAVGIDEVAGADDAPVPATVVVLLLPRTVPGRDLVIDIRQERERQLELLAEAPVARSVVGAHAPDGGVGRGLLLVDVAELAGLSLA